MSSSGAWGCPPIFLTVHTSRSIRAVPGLGEGDWLQQQTKHLAHQIPDPGGSCPLYEFWRREEFTQALFSLVACGIRLGLEGQEDQASSPVSGYPLASRQTFLCGKPTHGCGVGQGARGGNGPLPTGATPR